MNKIAVFSSGKRFKKFEKPVFSTVAELLEVLDKNNIYLEIYLAGNKMMKFLNKKFRNKNKAVDVLSFNEPIGFPRPELAGRDGIKKVKSIGEIYINMSKVNPPVGGQKSKVYLLAHGILHLLGYNHKKKSDRIKMERMELSVIKKLSNYLIA